MGLLEPAWACLGLLGLALVCARFACVCFGLLGLAWACLGLLELAWALDGSSKFTGSSAWVCFWFAWVLFLM